MVVAVAMATPGHRVVSRMGYVIHHWLVHVTERVGALVAAYTLQRGLPAHEAEERAGGAAERLGRVPMGMRSMPVGAVRIRLLVVAKGVPS